MKPIYEKLTENPDYSFLIRDIIRDERSDMHNAGIWHYHPDYEICFTHMSSGKRFVGYHMEDYSVGDLVLLGENLPHCWITDQHTEQVVITFKKDFLGKEFINRPELKEINHMLDRSKRGIRFGAETSLKAKRIIKSLDKKTGFERLMQFFTLLNLLAHSQDAYLISHIDPNLQSSIKASNRIERIYSYILRNYKQNNISLSELASEVNMTKTSLCKFIKNVTKKTLYDLVLEARVNEACRLLAETDKYISEICYLSGFNNISNFNKIFKRFMEKTPQEYRNIYSIS